MSAAEQTDGGRQETGKDGGTASLLRRGFDTANRYLTSRSTNPLAQTTDPRTPPSRLISSNYSSPGSTFGKDEDAVVIEVTPRYLLAGVEGESDPQCRISFTPDASRRVGDYRECLPGNKTRQESLRSWGREYELWRNNINGLDLDVMADKLERAVREIHNKYLLSDAGSSRLVLVVPSIVPHPVLDTMIFTLFERWRYPSITLLPAPMTAAISTGLRSALVIDIGWEETTITSLYECREVNAHRTIRAMKALTKSMAAALRQLAKSRPGLQNIRLDLPNIEELLIRSLHSIHSHDQSLQEVSSNARMDYGELSSTIDGAEADHLEIDWPTGSSTRPLRIPNVMISAAVEKTFWAEGSDCLDDEELTLPGLAFTALKSLPPDVRSICLSRVVFTGEGARLPLVKRRVMNDLRSMIQAKGWSHVNGTHVKLTGPHSELSSSRSQPADAKFNVPLVIDGDDIDAQVRKRKARTISDHISSGVSEVQSLGSWAGASLLTSLKIKGLVEIERDRFLSHGLVGASRETDVSITTQPQRVGIFGVAKSAKVPDKSNWTLAGWG